MEVTDIKMLASIQNKKLKLVIKTKYVRKNKNKINKKKIKPTEYIPFS